MVMLVVVVVVMARVLVMVIFDCFLHAVATSIMSIILEDTSMQEVVEFSAIYESK